MSSKKEIKSAIPYIYYHKTQASILQNFSLEGQILLSPIIKSVQKAKTMQNEECNSSQNITQQNISLYTNQDVYTLDSNNIKIKRIINFYLNIFRNSTTRQEILEENILHWQELRNFILQYPTLKQINTFDGVYRKSFENMYFKAHGSHYFFKKEGDFERILQISNRKEEDFQEVSLENARLDILWEVKDLKTCFKENNIEHQWKYTNLMTPIVYNNIYKGALGEVFGKYIVEKKTFIKLKEISATSSVIFECFDFSNETESVYFDFKHFSNYSASQQVTVESISEAIGYKLSQSEAKPKAVFIINLVAEIDKNYKEIKDIIHTKIQNRYGETYSVKIFIFPWLIKKVSYKQKAEIDILMLMRLKNFYNRVTNSC